MISLTIVPCQAGLLMNIKSKFVENLTVLYRSREFLKLESTLKKV